MSRMAGQRIYQDGARVDVWCKNRSDWVEGTVYGYEERDGVWKYLVQLSGSVAMVPSDPNSWFTGDEMRSAMGLGARPDDF
jgi:hypothetical protein